MAQNVKQGKGTPVVKKPDKGPKTHADLPQGAWDAMRGGPHGDYGRTIPPPDDTKKK